MPSSASSIAEALYRTYPDLDEGAKSKIRVLLVSSGRLARVGESLGLGEHLLLGRGEEKTGGRRKTALLADACEAICRGDLPRCRHERGGGLRAPRAVGSVRGVGWWPRRGGGGGARLQIGAAGSAAGTRARPAGIQDPRRAWPGARQGIRGSRSAPARCRPPRSAARRRTPNSRPQGRRCGSSPSTAACSPRRRHRRAERR